VRLLWEQEVVGSNPVTPIMEHTNSDVYYEVRIGTAMSIFLILTSIVQTFLLFLIYYTLIAGDKV
jgi:hypothetical protein